MRALPRPDHARLTGGAPSRTDAMPCSVQPVVRRAFQGLGGSAGMSRKGGRTGLSVGSVDRAAGPPGTEAGIRPCAAHQR